MTGDITTASLELYGKRPEDGGKTPVAVRPQQCRALDVSAALAVRHSGLPLYPAHAGELEARPVRVRFGPQEENTGVRWTSEIPAELVFLDQNGPEEPQAIRAHLLATGTSWDRMGLLYTAELQMDAGELADLLFDAYQEGTVDPGELYGWEQLHQKNEWLRAQTSAAATCVLFGPEPALQDLMEQHLVGFCAGALPWPCEETGMSVHVDGGKLTMRFIPEE